MRWAARWFSAGVPRLRPSIAASISARRGEKASITSRETPSISNRPSAWVLENHYDNFEVMEILREPYSGECFSGYENIDLSFIEAEAIVNNERADWKTPLENVKGVYLITDIGGVA